jgi:hypothetical protein
MKKSKIAPKHVLKTQIGNLYFEENQSQLPLFLSYANLKFSIQFNQNLLIDLLKICFKHINSNKEYARVFWHVANEYSFQEDYSTREVLFQPKTLVNLLSIDNEEAKKVLSLPKLKYVDYYTLGFQILIGDEFDDVNKPLFAYFLIQFLKDKPFKWPHFNKNATTITKQRLLKCDKLYQFIDDHPFFSVKYFLLLLNTKVELSPAQIMEWFIYKYVSYSSISLGYRTFYWDIAWEYLSRNESLWHDVNEDETEMIDYFQLHFPLLFEEYKSYDIGRLETYDYISMGIDEIRTGELPFDIQAVVARYLFLYLEDF